METFQSKSSPAYDRIPGHMGRSHNRKPTKQFTEQHHFSVPDIACGKMQHIYFLFVLSFIL